MRQDFLFQVQDLTSRPVPNPLLVTNAGGARLFDLRPPTTATYLLHDTSPGGQSVLFCKETDCRFEKKNHEDYVC